MNRENHSQTIENEKPMDQPLNQDRSTNDQSRPEESPRADTGENDGAPQPMAHPPEDTFVTEDSHRRPGQKIR